MGTRILLLVMLLSLSIGPVHAGYFTVSLYKFSGDKPDIPFEATTFEQDELMIAAGMRRDGKERESTAACAALIADETAPFELRAWAVRQKMTLDIYAGRCVDAVRTGRDWLREYGDKDPHAFYMRRVMCNAVVRRCGHDSVFHYDREELDAVFEDMFANHPPDNRYVINARFLYAKALKRLTAEDESLRFEAAKQFENAAAAMLDYMAREEYQQEPAAVRKRCELLLTACRGLMANLLSDRWTPPSRFTPSEISEQQNRTHPENSRQEQIDAGQTE